MQPPVVGAVKTSGRLERRLALDHAGERAATRRPPVRRRSMPGVRATRWTTCNLLRHQELFLSSCSSSLVLRRTGQDGKKMKINNAARLASTLASLFGAFGVAVSSLPSAAFAKKPGATYCINGVCHRVKTVDEVKAEIGLEVIQGASFYDQCEVDPDNPCTPLSSGEEFHADRPDNAASPIYPNGTLLALVNPKTNSTALVRINNSGPYFKGRLLDVSRATAVQLGFLDAGTAQLNVTVMPDPTVTAIAPIPTAGK